MFTIGATLTWRHVVLGTFIAHLLASHVPTQHPLIEQGQIDSHNRLNFSSAAPLIFHSTFGLLQQWSNTFFPNGHTIAPCTIPKNTNLYHAHQDGSFPDSPEWFAFDSAMAYTIMAANEKPHLYTFRTTKDVKCIYFDGTSASLMGGGSMDSQMLLIHNNSNNIPGDPIWGGQPRPPPRDDPSDGDRPPRPPGKHFNPLQAEYDRAVGLCDFIEEKNFGGLGWGYEGIVRMNAAFELVWCNFSSPSTQLVSRLNVTVPMLEGLKEPWDELEDFNHNLDLQFQQDRPPRGRRPHMLFNTQPFIQRSSYEWFHAAAKTYGFVGGVPGTGESRVKIESCGLFSFYDPMLLDQTGIRVHEERELLNLTADGFWQAPSTAAGRQIALQELGRRRRYQRATNVSVSDGKYMRQEVETRLRNVLSSESKDTDCSGVDWSSITRTIVSDYSPEMLDLRNLFSNDTDYSNATDVRRWLFYLRGATHNLWMPFYEYPPLPIATSNISMAFSLAAPQSVAALERCKNQYTPRTVIGLSTSERLTVASIVEVMTGICSTLLPIFLSIEALWLRHFNDVRKFPSKTSLPDDLQDTLAKTSEYHLAHLEELMAWLGWTEQWTTCSPACGLGQICAIPIWPVLGIGHFSGQRFAKDAKETEHEMYEEARCVDAENAYGRSAWDVK